MHTTQREKEIDMHVQHTNTKRRRSTLAELAVGAVMFTVLAFAAGTADGATSSAAIDRVRVGPSVPMDENGPGPRF